MKKSYFIIILFLVCTMPLRAQTVKGKVADANGRALQGVTIKVNDRGVTITDQNGVFAIDCKPGATVAASSVGYEPQSQTMQDCNSELSFLLVESTQLLEGVEITATSSQNKLMLNQPSSIAKLG